MTSRQNTVVQAEGFAMFRDRRGIVKSIYVDCCHRLPLIVLKRTDSWVGLMKKVGRQSVSRNMTWENMKSKRAP